MKVEIKDFIMQLRVMLVDEFVATIAEKGDELTLTFANGQKFLIKIQEI